MRCASVNRRRKTSLLKPRLPSSRSAASPLIGPDFSWRRWLTRRYVVLAIAVLLLSGAAVAQRGRSSSSRSSSSGSKSVHVRGYTKKDGTVVKAHDRKAPGTASSPSTKHSSVRYRRGYAAEGYQLHASVQRDSHGRIKRSRAARSAFMRQQPCPSTRKTSGRCPGYVVDHITALECGGADAPGNMQWQTTAAAKAKDKVEGVGCGIR